MEWLLDLITFILRQQGVCTIYIQIFTTDTKMDDRESSAGASSQGIEHLDHQQASVDLERWWMLSKTTSYPDLVRPHLLHNIRLAHRQLWDWTIMLHQILSSLQNTQTQNPYGGSSPILNGIGVKPEHQFIRPVPSNIDVEMQRCHREWMQHGKLWKCMGKKWLLGVHSSNCMDH